MNQKISGTAAGKSVTLLIGKKTVATKDVDQYGYYEFNNLTDATYTVKGDSGSVSVTLKDGSSAAKVDIKASSKPDVPVAVPMPVPVPVEPTPTPTPVPPAPEPIPAFTVVGACLTSGDLDGWAKKAIAAGINTVRTFTSGCRVGGNLNRAFFNPIQRALAANPTLKVIGMHGLDEPSTTPLPSSDDWTNYYKILANVIRGYETRYIVELFNEPNLKHYCDCGQDDSKVSQQVVNYVTNVAAIARRYLPASVYIIGPSVGYGALSSTHIDYAAAYKEAGLLGYINAYNTHLYPPNTTILEQVLKGIRALIGNSFDFYATEAQVKQGAAADYLKTAPAYLDLMRKYGVKPCVYRLLPRGDNDMDDRSIYDAKGNLRPDMSKAWGLS